ncbi:uncharacterized protein LOC109857530 isoform X3 [Pseudomyrmex gracilis]|uniref:uncharacterized protein LOC109857530 isoform X3 n=1 Tax=Pseudomyrmex gracilis TaxID=219809 RepID=UPI0009954424|nr:uncharacterized protein LOC109857530 isoform X3 [Pseudomyrmex gracilis]
MLDEKIGSRRIIRIFARLFLLHFEPSMWEKTRVDGSRKLKHDAVPTVFGLNLRKENEEKRRRRKSKNNIHQCHNSHVPSYQLQSKVIEKSKPNISNTDNISMIKEKDPNHLSDIKSITGTQNSSSTSCSQQESVKTDNQVSVLPQKCKSTCLCNKLAKKIIVLRQKLKHMRESFRKLKRENNRIKKEKSKNLYMSHLKQIFTNDQICALISSKPRQWSDDTIVKALQLKSACGERGYEELIKQNMPLPSIRTLQKRCQLSSELLNEFLKSSSLSEFLDKSKNE